MGMTDATFIVSCLGQHLFIWKDQVEPHTGVEAGVSIFSVSES